MTKKQVSILSLFFFMPSLSNLFLNYTFSSIYRLLYRGRIVSYLSLLCNWLMIFNRFNIQTFKDIKCKPVVLKLFCGRPKSNEIYEHLTTQDSNIERNIFLNFSTIPKFRESWLKIGNSPSSPKKVIVLFLIDFAQIL